MAQTEVMLSLSLEQFFFLPMFFFFFLVVFSLVCHITRRRRRDVQGRVDFNLIVEAESGVEE